MTLFNVSEHLTVFKVQGVTANIRFSLMSANIRLYLMFKGCQLTLTLFKVKRKPENTELYLSYREN